MKYLLLAMLSVVTLAPCANADQLPLPDDQDKWYFTTAGELPFSIQGEIVDELKWKMWYRHIPEYDPIYERYRPYIGATPSVFIQRPDGKVIYKASGANFPTSVAELEDEIVRCIRPRPKPEPTPAPLPTPAPEPDPVPDPVPDVLPAEPEQTDALNLFVLILSSVSGLAAGAVPELLKGK